MIQITTSGLTATTVETIKDAIGHQINSMQGDIKAGDPEAMPALFTITRTLYTLLTDDILEADTYDCIMDCLYDLRERKLKQLRRATSEVPINYDAVSNIGKAYDESQMALQELIDFGF